MLFLLIGAGPAWPQSAANVLLVINSQSTASVEIGAHYAKVRVIPDEQIVRISVPGEDEIARDVFERAIEAPVARHLLERALEDRIHFVVLTKGVPLRVKGTSGRQGTVASVDSELALLYRKFTGVQVNTLGPIANPYFLGDRDPAMAAPFTHRTHDIYLVTRLDAFTVEEAKGLVDRALAAERRGKVVLDMKASLSEAGNRALEATATRLAAAGFADQVRLERTGDVVTGERDVLGYYSWGSSDPSIKQRTFGFTFVPGAIAGMFVSSDARTFTAPPETWTLGEWRTPASYYAGSPQSLSGDLVREGVTGTVGYVAEPFLDGTARPDILFPAYLRGLTLAEAYYLALPHVSWQGVVVGDPLCRVGPPPEVSAADLDPGVDPVTEFPRYLSERKVAGLVATAPRMNREALTLFVKAQRQVALRQLEGARPTLERATALEPTLVGAQTLLADLYGGAGEHEASIARYEAVLKLQPSNVIVLNNLAYALAVNRGKPADALPIAQRAYALAGRSPLIADTLGWVHHLLGNTRDAFTYVKEAVTAMPNQPEIRYHWAAVLATAGDRQTARRELDAALQLDATLKERADVKALQDALK